MATYASVTIVDEEGRTAYVNLGSDGHALGPILLDYAEQWHNPNGEDEPPPLTGTVASFAAGLCGPGWAQRHNSQVDAHPADAEFRYTVQITGGRATRIVAQRRHHDHATFIAAIKADRDPLPFGHYVERWRIDFPTA